MANQSNSRNSETWTSTQAYVFAIICLVIGIAVGYFVRGSGTPTASDGHDHSAQSAAPGSGQVTPEQLKHMADTQAKPILDQLKSSPNNAALLAQAGNVYYDAQIYPEAIEYYRKSLANDPNNANVRTDLGTAVWYQGDADGAITEFDKALAAEPNKAQTLFNMGMVKWRGKMDIKGAIADWERLLQTNPNYPERKQVEELLAQVKQHANLPADAKTTKPIQ